MNKAFTIEARRIELTVGKSSTSRVPSLSDSPNYIRSVLHAFNSKLGVVAISAATGIMTARALHPQGRGELAAMAIWPLVLSGSLTLGLPSALTYMIQRKPGQKAQMTTAAALTTTLVGIVATAIAIAIVPFFLRNYSSETVFVARCLLPSLTIGLLLLIGRAALEAEHQFGRSGIALVVPPVLTLAMLSSFLLMHRLTPTTAAISYVVSGLPALCWLFCLVPFSLRIPLQTLSESARALLSYGIRSYGIDLCGTVSLYIDQAVVVGLLSPVDMGRYVVSLSFSRLTSVLHQALAGVLFPSLVNLDQRKTYAIIDRIFRFGVSITVLATVFMFAAGQIVLAALYGSAFARDVLILPILTLEAGLGGCVLIAAQAFMANNRPGLITTQQIIGLSATVPLLFVLVPLLGIRGAALSILLSTVLRLGFILISYRRTFGTMPGFLMNGATILWVSERLNLPGVRFLLDRNRSDETQSSSV
jgi:O-antigen/teichoic acid export membrane protein